MIIVVLFTILTVEVPSRSMSRVALIRMKKFCVSNIILSMDKLVILGIIKISFAIFYFICTENWLYSIRIPYVAYYSWWKSFMFFTDYFTTTKILVNCYTWILWKVVKTGNCKGMKIKTWNSKTFSSQIISNIWYISLQFTNIQWQYYNLSINHVTTIYNMLL